MSVTFYEITAIKNKEILVTTTQIVPRIGEFIRIYNKKYEVVSVEHIIEVNHTINVYCNQV